MLQLKYKLLQPQLYKKNSKTFSLLSSTLQGCIRIETVILYHTSKDIFEHIKCYQKLFFTVLQENVAFNNDFHCC